MMFVSSSALPWYTYLAKHVSVPLVRGGLNSVVDIPRRDFVILEVACFLSRDERYAHFRGDGIGVGGLAPAEDCTDPVVEKPDGSLVFP